LERTLGKGRVEGRREKQGMRVEGREVGEAGKRGKRQKQCTGGAEEGEARCKGGERMREKQGTTRLEEGEAGYKGTGKRAKQR
jgi:hypothetical protein